MCNYCITTNQAAIIALFGVVNRYVGNLASDAGVFPDYLIRLRWCATSTPGRDRADLSHTLEMCGRSLCLR
jgi:hypothetical protein